MKTIDRSTPAALGYRMPAEWEPHDATWLAWPYNPLTWERHLEGAERAFTELIALLAPHEDIHLCIPNAWVEARARAALGRVVLNSRSLHFHTIETGDVWFRDFGPIFLVQSPPPQSKESAGEGSRIAWTKWTYNALGNKYADLLIGNDVPDKMPIAHLPRFSAGIVLEGGSIDVDGSGSLLTTESCLFSSDRNPGLTRNEIERILHDYLGATNILWLKEGIAGDDTTGHVDDVARFVGPSTVITMVEHDPFDENHAALAENLQRLQGMHDAVGAPLTVIEIPMPKPFAVDGRRMAASYANFYVGNGAVAVPVYRQPTDVVALRILQECFPDRTVCGIDCTELIFGYGALHCCTQQQPR